MIRRVGFICVFSLALFGSAATLGQVATLIDFEIKDALKIEPGRTGYTSLPMANMTIEREKIRPDRRRLQRCAV